jgi:hypothetical protein
LPLRDYAHAIAMLRQSQGLEMLKVVVDQTAGGTGL